MAALLGTMSATKLGLVFLFSAAMVAVPILLGAYVGKSLNLFTGEWCADEIGLFAALFVHLLLVSFISSSANFAHDLRREVTRWFGA